LRIVFLAVCIPDDLHAFRLVQVKLVVELTVDDLAILCMQGRIFEVRHRYLVAIVPAHNVVYSGGNSWSVFIAHYLSLSAGAIRLLAPPSFQSPAPLGTGYALGLSRTHDPAGVSKDGRRSEGSPRTPGLGKDARLESFSKFPHVLASTFPLTFVLVEIRG